MGMIRKTLSITTLGLVGWKSKKEQLAETESELARARHELEQTSSIRDALEERLGSVEKRLAGAELEAIHDAKAARRDERRKQRRARIEAAAHEAEARADKARKQAEARAEEARAKLEKTTRRARKKAQKAAKDARKRLGR
jgi:chromosome segregation ATPase